MTSSGVRGRSKAPGVPTSQRITLANVTMPAKYCAGYFLATTVRATASRFHRVRLWCSPTKRCYTCTITEVENVTDTRPVRPSALRVRRHRERRREGLRLLALEMPQPLIDAAIARGFLKPEDSTRAWSVIQSVYATQLSDKALNWLTDNAVITTEQRTNAAAILRCISNWVEGATNK